MQFNLINLLMPHYCCSCGAIGAILCDYCKYDIVNDGVGECMACERPVARYGDVCGVCLPAYKRAWIVGRHRDSLRELIASYKFDGARSASLSLAALLHESLPELPDDVIITSVPTARPHIRERGYDHAAMLARRFARLRKLPYRATLERLHTKTQRGSTRAERLKQAATAFEAMDGVRNVRYLLVDDVCTTGATAHYAARALRAAGAREVWVAVVSREPLD